MKEREIEATQTIRRYMKSGMTIEQAIEKWEGQQPYPMPAHIKKIVEWEVNSHGDFITNTQEGTPSG